MPSWEVTTADLPAVDPVNIICTIINSRHSNADSKQTAFTILTDFVSTSVAVAGGDVGALAGLALNRLRKKSRFWKNGHETGSQREPRSN